MILNEYLTALRKQQKKTQTEVAKAIGCSPPHINDIEKGHRRPSLKNCEKLAQVYGVPFAGLVERLFQHQLDKAGLPLQVKIKPRKGPPLTEEGQDAVNEMVHRGWARGEAICEVITNRDLQGSKREPR